MRADLIILSDIFCPGIVCIPYLLLIPRLQFLFYSLSRKLFFFITEHFQKHPLYFAIYLQVVISCDLWKIVFLAYIFSPNPSYSISSLFLQVWHIGISLSNPVIFEQSRCVFVISAPEVLFLLLLTTFEGYIFVFANVLFSCWCML